MIKKMPNGGSNEVKATLKAKAFEEVEKNNKIKLPRCCRHIIKNGMTIEIGVRISDKLETKQIEAFLKPLTSFIETVEVESRLIDFGKDKTKDIISALHLMDIRLSKLRLPGESELKGRELLLDLLSGIQRELAQKLPTPPKHQKAKQWIRKLHEKLGIAEPRERKRPQKSRGQIYSELAWVWSEIGQRVIAKKNPTIRFVRFVKDITSRFPDLKLHTNLKDDIERWHKQYQPLTADERAANDWLAKEYREKRLKFRVSPLLASESPARLQYDAARPQE